MTKKPPVPRRPSRPDDGEAFLPDPEQGGRARTADDLAEELAEEFVRSATSAEEAGADARDEVLPEELGGPFVEVPASEEFDRAPDASNPQDAEKEPFPRAIRVPYR
jgi:hypothetical protein